MPNNAAWYGASWRAELRDVDCRHTSRPFEPYGCASPKARISRYVKIADKETIGNQRVHDWPNLADQPAPLRPDKEPERSNDPQCQFRRRMAPWKIVDRQEIRREIDGERNRFAFSIMQVAYADRWRRVLSAHPAGQGPD